MRKSGRWLLPLLAGVAVLATGCATQEEINELRAAVAGAQSTAEAAEQRAASAADRATSAADMASEAERRAGSAERADRIFQQSLRK